MDVNARAASLFACAPRRRFMDWLLPGVDAKVPRLSVCWSILRRLAPPLRWLDYVYGCLAATPWRRLFGLHCGACPLYALTALLIGCRCPRRLLDRLCPSAPPPRLAAARCRCPSAPTFRLLEPAPLTCATLEVAGLCILLAVVSLSPARTRLSVMPLVLPRPCVPPWAPLAPG